MRDSETFTQIIVSRLGTPHDYWGEVIGGAFVLLAFLAYFSLEYGLSVLLRKLWRVITTGSAKRDDQP